MKVPQMPSDVQMHEISDSIEGAGAESVRPPAPAGADAVIIVTFAGAMVDPDG
jgi:hypothetical protein